MDVRVKSVLAKIDENAVAILLVIVAVSTRLLPHPANFAAVGAVALFSGTYLKKKYALWLPLIIMMVSDVIIGLHNLILFTWGSFILMGCIGLWVRKNKNVQNVIFGTITGSLVFFFVTNFAVWAFTPFYAKTLQGLLQCFVLALPFFRNSLAGDVFYVGVLYGAYEGAIYLLPRLKKNMGLVQATNK
ncbi:MAG: hypothetical protein Q7S53_05385 [bacterium]|nr:hypothetical protein [bacterium]